MSSSDRFKALAEKLRGLPAAYGLRPYTVSIEVRTGTGTSGLDTPSQDSLTPLLENGENPKVRWLSHEEIALGNLNGGEIEVGPITPTHLTGGVSWIDLTESTADTQDRLYFWVVGPEFPSGKRFEVAGGRSDRGLHYLIRLRPVA